jgi:hypothetical protein
VICGYFPLQLCPASISAVLDGSCSEQLLVESFLRHVAPHDRVVLEAALSNKDVVTKERQSLIRILSNYGAKELPNPTNFEELLSSVACSRLIFEPFYPLMEMRHGMFAHRLLWLGVKEDTMTMLFESLKPTHTKVRFFIFKHMLLSTACPSVLSIKKLL